MVKVDDKIQAIFRKGICLFYLDTPGTTLTDAYRRTLVGFFNQGYEQRDGMSVPIMPPLEELPTLRQFRYWYKKERKLAEAYASHDRQGRLNHRQSSMARCIEPETIHLSLLRSATASVTEQGIYFQGLYYVCERAVREQWFVTARTNGRRKISIAYDPCNCDKIYLHPVNGEASEVCTLASRSTAFQGLSWDEVANYFDAHSIRASSLRERSNNRRNLVDVRTLDRVPYPNHQRRRREPSETENTFVEQREHRQNQRPTTPFDQWLERQRLRRRSGLALGNSSEQGTAQCQSYVLERNPQLQPILSPLVPIPYILASPDMNERELLQLIIESTNRRLAKGTIVQVYDWTLQLLKECRAEMLIIDAADNLNPESIALAGQIGEELKIAVILVGSGRLEIVISPDWQFHRCFANRYVFKPVVP